MSTIARSGKCLYVDFIEVERITGKVLVNSILHWLRINNILPVANVMMDRPKCLVLDLVSGSFSKKLLLKKCTTTVQLTT